MSKLFVSIKLSDTLRTVLISSFFACIISIGGFLFNYYYFLPKAQAYSYGLKGQSKFLETTSKIYNDITNYNDSISPEIKQRGLSINAFHSIKNRYDEFLNDLKNLDIEMQSFGSNEQLSINKTFINCLEGISELILHQCYRINFLYQEISLAKTKVKNVDSLLKDKIIREKLCVNLDTVISHESYLFYYLRVVSFPYLKDLKVLNHSIYRSKANLSSTERILEAQFNIRYLKYSKEDKRYIPMKDLSHYYFEDQIYFAYGNYEAGTVLKRHPSEYKTIHPNRIKYLRQYISMADSDFKYKLIW